MLMPSTAATALLSAAVGRRSRECLPSLTMALAAICEAVLGGYLRIGIGPSSQAFRRTHLFVTSESFPVSFGPIASW